jgi:AraC family transcriptional regulator
VLRVTRVWESALAAIDRVDHPAGVPHVDPNEEASSQYSINLLERGHFSIVHSSRRWRVGANEIFVTVPGQIHRYIHDDSDGAPGDSCIAVCFKDPVRDDVGAQLRVRPSGAPVVRMNNRHVYLRHRLFDRLATAPDSMALDALAMELLDALADTKPRRLHRPSQLAWYAARIDNARRRLDDQFSDEHTLASLARDANMGAYHFAHIFRELTGLPPHRYLLRRRLGAAAGMLRDGRSVTETCFAVGFQSLSHFVHTFRRAFGVTPSRFARPR